LSIRASFRTDEATNGCEIALVDEISPRATRRTRLMMRRIDVFCAISRRSNLNSVKELLVVFMHSDDNDTYARMTPMIRAALIPVMPGILRSTTSGVSRPVLQCFVVINGLANDHDVLLVFKVAP